MFQNTNKGKNLKDLKENNINVILKLLAINGETSRAELSEKLGLAKMTITNITAFLKDKGYIVETKKSTNEKATKTGPRPMFLTIKQNRILSIGIYVSRESIYCSLSDISEGELYFDRTILNEDDTEVTLTKKMIMAIERVLSWKTKFNKNIIGIGIAMVGLVDNANGILASTTDFFGVKHLKIKEILEKEFEYPVFVKNEVQAAVLAEQLYGHGKKISNFIYFGITYGIGTAVVSNGKVLTGSKGFATEAGHMSVDLNGERCSCGNRGCLELYASLPVLLRNAEVETIEEFVKKVEEKDELVMKVRERFIEVLDVAITSLTNIFDPEYIIMGHEGALLDSELFVELEEKINEHCIQRDEHHVYVEKSTFLDKAALRGATSIVFDELFSGNMREYAKYME